MGYCSGEYRACLPAVMGRMSLVYRPVMEPVKILEDAQVEGKG